MFKTLIKIAVALLVLHGAFRLGNAYWNFYRFEDALQELAQFGDRKAEPQLCDGAVDAASSYAIPITAAQIFVKRGAMAPYNCQTGPSAPDANAPQQAATQLGIYGTYTEQVQLLPGYYYPWDFSPSVKVWVRP